MTTAPGFAAYIASLPRVLAGAAALFRDAEGRVLLVEPNYREGWARAPCRGVSPSSDSVVPPEDAQHSERGQGLKRHDEVIPDPGGARPACHP
ncbi:hypothetical protein ABZ698_41585, partial [Streptomyces antibioticus]